MNFKTHLLIALLVISTIGLILSGCSSGSSPSATAPVTTAPSGATTQPAANTTPSATGTSAAPTQTTTAASTTPSTDAANTPRYGGTFKLGAEAGPPTLLGWPAESQGESSRFQAPMLEPLVKADNKANIIPWLAASWDVAEDYSSVTFHLRKDVKFHDGSIFNASVVKFNLDAVIAGKKSGTAYWKSVEVIDDYTVKVNVTTWQNSTLSGFGEAQAFMVSKEAYDKNGVDWMKSHPIGTGPFKFVSFERDVAVKYARNDNYWQAGKPYVDALEYIILADPMTEEAMMKSLSLDALGTSPGTLANNLQKAGIPVHSGIIGVYPMTPDSANPDSPFYDVRVRQAVEYAIDKEAIAKTLSYGFWDAAYQWSTPDNLSWDNTVVNRTYDVAKAKQLLAEAGFPDGFKTRLVVSPVSRNKDMILAIQSYLSKVGIQAEIELPEMAAFFQMRTTGWKNALLFEGSPISANPLGSYKQVLDPANHWWESIIKSEELLKRLNEALSTPAADPALAQKLVHYVWDQNLIIPIGYLAEVYPMQPWVHDPGFNTISNPMYWHPENVWLSEKK